MSEPRPSPLAEREAQARIGMLVAELQRVITAHTDSLDPHNARAIAAEAISEVYGDTLVEALKLRFGREPTVEEAHARMRVYPWAKMFEQVFERRQLEREAGAR